MIPEHQFSMFAGASGCGKTTFLLQAWLEHERGKEWPVMFPQDCKSCGFIIADRTKGEAETRAEFLGIKNIEFYGLVDDLSLNLSLFKDPIKLWETCFSRFQKHHGLVIVDPIGLFMQGNLNEFRSVAMSGASFARYAKQVGSTIIGVHHTTKARSDTGFLRPQDRVSGSGAFAGYSSTQCMMIEGLEGGEDYDTLVIVPHMTPKEEYRLVRRQDGYFSLYEKSAKNTVEEALRASSMMKLQAFSNLCHTYGMTDSEVEEWLFSKELDIKGEFVRLSTPA